MTNFSILSSPGGSFGTSCSYELTALTSTDEADVYFYDDGDLIGSGGVTPRDGVATIDWTPQTQVHTSSTLSRAVYRDCRFRCR
ncbi:hypothetical protein GIY30_11810 [Gordonia sp. HNM0687]|uniref:Uncharacterized protein n=1 Tax=Gordonia mangrovi TaxID=2665643 RepID=A0A6L7GSD3_9ACTN|nr:hypothetical protein [Gordonia mangrovi]MXP22031.1 hypothetical protein [Gordonia mangrovi]UVF78039.1 hypothetical protein NWF22_22925 [Gordonia mangrovi]